MTDQPGTTGPPVPSCEQVPAVIGHVFGALEPDEEDLLTAHLTDCADCRRAVDDTRTVTVALGRAVPQIDPPPALRERVLAAARAEPEPARRPAPELRGSDPGSLAPAPMPGDRPPRDPEAGADTDPGAGPHRRPGRGRRSALLAVVAAAVIGVALLGVRAVLPTESGPAARDSTSQAQRAQRIVDGAASREPGTRHATLRGGDGDPMAVVLDEPGGARVVPVAMTDLGQGRRYVLWATGPSAAVPVATVDPAAGTTVPLPGVAPPPSPRAYAVSIEPTGPVPIRPTTVMGVGVLV